ncbi:related to FMC1 - mitochondrial matrix protein, required for assembly of F1F0 ATP synthase [Melanopsichium pennsylvanicum]|uniref:Related to FMC1 - mitochondrial matrix protein, required for assembly of F1F0 ATP synthase n=2 Tax=Melanopsichium pennsylvanicum TaxID=63383 RepID=A0AAJ5C4G9_9BASI|nr:conserved hypothetical protein [Melanopsichium pennsylvanicum 4]SNX83685.1 related to FMC1 - mitochondrial matrix protein, required for assembly of F1F0 ATP synthase [Melanopsichium pennsylvanicum]
MFATAKRSMAVKALYDDVVKLAERSVKTGPLASYLQKEFKDVATGIVSSSPKSTSDYTPFIPPNKTTEQMRQQNLENLHIFLTNKALHAELLQRYNPTTAMSEEERIRLTARRVGLDVPITHNPSAASTSMSDTDSANNYRESAQIAQNKYEQDKHHRQGQLYSGNGDGLNVGGPLRPPGSKE